MVILGALLRLRLLKLLKLLYFFVQLFCFGQVALLLDFDTLKQVLFDQVQTLPLLNLLAGKLERYFK